MTTCHSGRGRWLVLHTSRVQVIATIARRANARIDASFIANTDPHGCRLISPHDLAYTIRNVTIMMTSWTDDIWCNDDNNSNDYLCFENRHQMLMRCNAFQLHWTEQIFAWYLLIADFAKRILVGLGGLSMLTLNYRQFYFSFKNHRRERKL